MVLWPPQLPGNSCSNSCHSAAHTRSRCSQPARLIAGSERPDSSVAKRVDNTGDTSCCRAAQYSAWHSCSRREYSGRLLRDSTSRNRPATPGEEEGGERAVIYHAAPVQARR